MEFLPLSPPSHPHSLNDDVVVSVLVETKISPALCSPTVTGYLTAVVNNLHTTLLIMFLMLTATTWERIFDEGGREPIILNIMVTHGNTWSHHSNKWLTHGST